VSLRENYKQGKKYAGLTFNEQGVISCYSISEGVYKEIGFNDGVSHNGGVVNDSSTKCAVAL
jgi:hypothetical protein